MPFKNFVDDSRLYADDLNTYWLQQAHVVKAVDESITSSATLQDDDELFLPLLANSEYWLECFIIYGANQTADIRVTFSVPSGTTFSALHNSLRTGHTTGDGFDTISRSELTEVSTGGLPGGIHATANTTLAVCPIEGRIIVGGTAGNVRFRWCQGTSNATATVVRANSVMILQRLTV